jgi:hypothetical protein
MNYDRIDFVRDEISVAIRNSMIEPPREVIIKDLIDEWIGPVCSPEYAARHFRNSSDLHQCVLLATKTRLRVRKGPPSPYRYPSQALPTPRQKRPRSCLASVLACSLILKLTLYRTDRIAPIQRIPSLLIGLCCAVDEHPIIENLSIPRGSQ